MKITWRLPENYWVGSKGLCDMCGTRFELDDGDRPMPGGFGYTESEDLYGKVTKAYYIKMLVGCPVCQEDVILSQEVS